ncbi:MAG: hypothetical protein ACYC3H_01430 [Bellilinea sp.]
MEIVTGKTIAQRDRCKTLIEWLKKAAIRKGVTLDPTAISDSEVVARIDHGRWIADCECNGAEYVDPGEPVFFCLSCLNGSNGGRLRPVKFPSPEVREQIIAGLTTDNFHSWNEKEEPYGIQPSAHGRNRRSLDRKQS